MLTSRTGKSDLLSASRAASLLEQQRTRRSDLLASERDRLRLQREGEARLHAAQTFPTLGGPSPGGSRSHSPAPAPGPAQSHKVLSLGKGGRVTTTTTQIRPSRPRSDAGATATTTEPAVADTAASQTALANRQARKDAARGWADPFDQANAATGVEIATVAGRPFVHPEPDMQIVYRPSALADA